MQNLASNIHDQTHEVVLELLRARVNLVRNPETKGEVISGVAGQLGAFKFQRAWTYWIVTGTVPFEVAKHLYADPVGATDIRVDGHCGCQPPTGDVRSYHIDSEVGLRIFVDEIRKLS